MNTEILTPETVINNKQILKNFDNNEKSKDIQTRVLNEILRQYYRETINIVNQEFYPFFLDLQHTAQLGIIDADTYKKKKNSLKQFNTYKFFFEDKRYESFSYVTSNDTFYYITESDFAAITNS